MNLRSATLPATLLAMLTASSALAQDSGLYPDPGAPDASFVRVIAPEARSAVIDGQELDVAGNGVSSYVEVSPGALTLETGGTEAELEVGANTHYTYADGELVEDQVKASPAQADLLIYNLSEVEGLDLYAVEADTAALSDVAAGAHRGVGLKAPLTLTFELRKEGETLAELDPVDLRRGTGSSVIVTGTAGDLTATSATSTYAE